MDIRSRIRKVLDDEARAIASVEVTPAFETAVEVLFATRGKVVTTGMGKAGKAAGKLAGTLCSTGTPAAFVHPGESAHGDLGLLTKDDVVVALSTSGKTREVLEMLRAARQLGVAHIIGITSHPDSEIRSVADVVLDMGVVVEPCPLGLTPTASIAVMMAIADGLALALMERKGVSRSDFGRFHHGGYLGEAARRER